MASEARDFVSPQNSSYFTEWNYRLSHLNSWFWLQHFVGNQLAQLWLQTDGIINPPLPYWKHFKEIFPKTNLDLEFFGKASLQGMSASNFSFCPGSLWFTNQPTNQPKWCPNRTEAVFPLKSLGWSWVTTNTNRVKYPWKDDSIPYSFPSCFQRGKDHKPRQTAGRHESHHLATPPRRPAQTLQTELIIDCCKPSRPTTARHLILAKNS